MASYTLSTPPDDPPEAGPLVQALKDALQAAHNRGSDDARRKLVTLLNAETTTARTLAPLNRSDKTHLPRAGQSVRRRISGIVCDILAQEPGLLTNEVEGRVRSRDGRIAMRSVVIELREGDQTLYRQERGRWFLAREPAGPTSETNPADPSS